MFVITSFLLGILMILDPCTLFTGIVAVAYIDREVNNKRRVFSTGLMFVLGKLLTYTILSYSIMWGIKSLSLDDFFSKEYGEVLLSAFMLVCGVLLLVVGHGHHNHDHGVSKWMQTVDEKSNNLWAFMLGIFFSIAFCPHRLIYFFTMVDMSVEAQHALSWILPIVFGLGTGLPILIVAWIISYSLVSVNALQQKVKKYEPYIRYACAVLFIAYGLYSGISYFCGHEHHHHHDHDHSNEVSLRERVFGDCRDAVVSPASCFMSVFLPL